MSTLEKKERSQVNDLGFHLKKLEKKSKLNPRQIEKKNNIKDKINKMKI